MSRESARVMNETRAANAEMDLDLMRGGDFRGPLSSVKEELRVEEAIHRLTDLACDSAHYLASQGVERPDEVIAERIRSALMSNYLAEVNGEE